MSIVNLIRLNKLEPSINLIEKEEAVEVYFNGNQQLIW